MPRFHLSSILHKIVLLTYLLTLVVSLARAWCFLEECLECPQDNQDPYIYEVSQTHNYSYHKVNVTHDENQYVNRAGVVFYCRSSYPVEWEFEGKDFAINSVVSSKVYVDNILTPSKTCYEAKLWIGSDHPIAVSFTGNYTCKSVDGKKSFSFYRFSYVERESVFNTKENTEAVIQIDKNSAQVVIPCSSHVEKLNATLIKNGNPVPSGNKADVTYDPKYGFILNTTSSPEELSGYYECQGEFGDRKDTVTITVPSPKYFEVSPAESYLTFTSDKITLSCKSNESVEMLYENKDSSIHHKSRSVVYPGEYFEYGATTELFKKRAVNSFRGHVKCVKRMSEEVLWTWKYDTDYSCQCTWPLVKNDTMDETGFLSPADHELPAPQLMNLTCTTKANSPLDFVFIHCSNPTECKLRFDHILEDNSWNYHFTDRSLRSGVIACQAGEYTTRLMAIADLDKLYIDREPVQNLSSLMRIKGPKSEIHLGEKAEFSCQRTKYHLGKTVKWVLVYKNGTLEEVALHPHLIIGDFGHRADLVFIEIASGEVKEVMCLAPEWNSSKWRNVTYPIKVSNATFRPPLTIKNTFKTI